MAERTTRRAGIDEQLWPIVCATMVLVGILGVIVCANSDFDEDRLLLNGYTHLAGLAVAAALLIVIASRLKGAARRTAELAILLSLVLHSAAGVGAFYLFTSPLSGSNPSDAARDARPEFDDDSLPPDYHWAQDDEQQPEQAFEQVVATTIREPQAPRPRRRPGAAARSWSVLRRRSISLAYLMSISRPWAWAGPPNQAGPWTSVARTPPRSKRSSLPRPWPWSGKRLMRHPCLRPSRPLPSPCPRLPRNRPRARARRRPSG